MKSIIGFFEQFPNEQKCKEHFLTYRQTQGITCKNCNNQAHKWLEAKQQFECANKACRFRTTLKSGTMLESSKLPFKHWFIAMWYITSVKKSFSALELQRQIGHKYYEPIWYMMVKIRRVMGARDKQYKLSGEIELDEGFFETVMVKEDRDLIQAQIKEGTFQQAVQKRGRGSDKQAKALVMVESEEVKKAYINKKGNTQYRIQKRVKFIKMTSIESLKAIDITYEVKQHVEPAATLSTDNSTSYTKLKTLVEKHVAKTTNKDEKKDHLPWLHTIIANAKRDFLSRHHSISKKYFQLYLNEFCYKFNRRNMDIFDRLMVAGVAQGWNM